MKSFGGLFYEAFLRVNGWLIGLISLVFSILAYKYEAGTKVPIWLVLVIVAVLLLTLVVAVDAALIAWRRSAQGLPEVRSSLPAPPIYAGIKRILLLSPSDIYGFDSLVSLYLKEDDYEVLVGVGRVLTIQTNGYIQVGLTQLLDAQQDVVKKIENNDVALLKKLVVKPTFPFNLFPGV